MSRRRRRPPPPPPPSIKLPVTRVQRDLMTHFLTWITDSSARIKIRGRYRPVFSRVYAIGTNQCRKRPTTNRHLQPTWVWLRNWTTLCSFFLHCSMQRLRCCFYYLSLLQLCSLALRDSNATTTLVCTHLGIGPFFYTQHASVSRTFFRPVANHTSIPRPLTMSVITRLKCSTRRGRRSPYRLRCAILPHNNVYTLRARKS